MPTEIEKAIAKTKLAVASHAGRVPAGGTYSTDEAISVLSALAQSTRLEIFRLLLRHEPIGITAGSIADAIGAPHNTISSHLAILVRARLLMSTREGRTIVYRADIEGMRSLIGFLVNDCCEKNPQLCNFVTDESGGGCSRVAPTKSKNRKG